MMMKKEVAVCDICKDRIASPTKKGYLQCEICEKHVCDNCYSTCDIDFQGDEINTLVVCITCEDKIDSSKHKIDKNNEIKNQIIGHFKKVFIIKALEKGSKNE